MTVFEKIRLYGLVKKLVKEIRQMKNWKTTVAGAMSAAGAGMATVEEPIVSLIGKILVILGPAILGWVAKDAGVTGPAK